MATWSSSKIKLVNNKCQPPIMLKLCARCLGYSGLGKRRVWGIRERFINEMALSLKRLVHVCQENG